MSTTDDTKSTSTTKHRRGRSKRTAVVNDGHHNRKLDVDATADLIARKLTGDSDEDAADAVGVCKASARSVYREIELPDWYPEPGEVSQTIKSLMEIALLKALHRLAKSGVEEMDIRQTPVTVGILTDKLQLLNGAPTSYSFQAHVSVGHSALIDKIRGANERNAIPQPPQQHIINVVRTLSAGADAQPGPDSTSVSKQGGEGVGGGGLV